MDSKVVREIIIKNLWLFFRMPFFACFGVLIITALIFPTAGLAGRDVCKPIEMLLPFLGVIAMVPIFLPEQDEAIYDSVACRKMDMIAVYFIRLILALMLIVIFVLMFCAFLKGNECVVTAYIIWGGIASAFFMGSIGFMAAGISGNVINGLLASTIYYLCNFGLRKQLGVLYLFRMSTGVYEGKVWLFAVGLMFVIATFIILKGRK